jgi:hypothetical protein
MACPTFTATPGTTVPAAWGAAVTLAATSGNFGLRGSAVVVCGDGTEYPCTTVSWLASSPSIVVALPSPQPCAGPYQLTVSIFRRIGMQDVCSIPLQVASTPAGPVVLAVTGPNGEPYLVSKNQIVINGTGFGASGPGSVAQIRGVGSPIVVESWTNTKIVGRVPPVSLLQPLTTASSPLLVRVTVEVRTTTGSSAAPTAIPVMLPPPAIRTIGATGAPGSRLVLGIENDATQADFLGANDTARNLVSLFVDRPSVPATPPLVPTVDQQTYLTQSQAALSGVANQVPMSEFRDTWAIGTIPSQFPPDATQDAQAKWLVATRDGVPSNPVDVSAKNIRIKIRGVPIPSVPVPPILFLFENSDYTGKLLVVARQWSAGALTPAAVSSALDALNVPGLPPLLQTAIGLLKSALAAVEPRDVFLLVQKEVSDFWDFEYRGWPARVSAEDIMSSLIVIGPAGTKVHCFNAPDFSDREGDFLVTVGPENVVLCRSLMRRTVADPTPDYMPDVLTPDVPRRLVVLRPPDFLKGPFHVITFRDELSSVRFEE